MGDSEFRGRQHVSIYVEHAWGDAIVATWVETPKPGALAASGLVEAQGRLAYHHPNAQCDG